MTDSEFEGAVRNGVGHVKDAAGGLTGDAALQAKGKLDEIAGSAQKAFGRAADQAGDVLGAAQYKAADIYDLLVDYVREKPGVSVAISAAAGLVLGMVLNRPRVVLRRS